MRHSMAGGAVSRLVDHSFYGLLYWLNRERSTCLPDLKLSGSGLSLWEFIL